MSWNPSAPRVRLSPAKVSENVTNVLRGWQTTEGEVKACSPVSIPCDPWEQLVALSSTIFAPSEFVRLVAGYKRAGALKEAPIGRKITLLSREIPEFVREREFESYFRASGGYMGANPVRQEEGSGKNGAFKDDDVAKYRYAVIEHDDLSKPEQLNLLCALHLPIISIVDSGGSSLHALVKIDANSLSDFKKCANRLYLLLARLGYDPANRNASRLTRFPGPQRRFIDGSLSTQRLLYLNPDPQSSPIKELLTQLLRPQQPPTEVCHV